jgi:translation elongation factor EF-4
MKDGEYKLCTNPSEFPENMYKVQSIEEPIISSKIIIPNEYLGAVMRISDERRGKQTHLEYLGDRIVLEYEFPLAEIVENHFFNELKKCTSGYASLSMDLENTKYSGSDVVRMEVTLNGERVDCLSSLTHKDAGMDRARSLAQQLSKLIPRQLFDVAVQVSLNGKSVAKETIKQMRKNVTAKLYGGDETRKMKLLEKQKEGKRKMKSIGKVNVEPDLFAKVIQQQKP